MSQWGIELTCIGYVVIAAPCPLRVYALLLEKMGK